MFSGIARLCMQRQELANFEPSIGQLLQLLLLLLLLHGLLLSIKLLIHCWTVIMHAETSAGKL